jgi:hypothetical protein
MESLQSTVYFMQETTAYSRVLFEETTVPQVGDVIKGFVVTEVSPPDPAKGTRATMVTVRRVNK